MGSGSPFEKTIGVSRAVRVGDRVLVSGTAPELFAQIRLAATMVIVAGLLDPRWKVEIEAEVMIAS